MRKRTVVSILILTAAVVLLIGILFWQRNVDHRKRISGQSAEDLLSQITVGWNLGNTFDCTSSTVLASALDRTGEEGTDYETLWGNPVVTAEMIQAVHEKGFNAIRIPVTWGHHLVDDGTGNVTISSAFLDEVKRVVDLAYNEGMYVILNSHHDTADYSNGLSIAEAGDTGLTWEMLHPYELFEAGTTMSIDSQCDNVSRLWNAIALEFQDYDQHLIFEGFNEIQGDERNWKQPSDLQMEETNQLNNAFIEAVRETGGNNTDRILIVQTYAGYRTPELMQTLAVSDSADQRIAEEVHLYIQEGGQIDEELFTEIRENAKYPVLIGEFGYQGNSLSSSELGDMFYQAAVFSRQNQIPVFYWDDGNMEGYGLFDRNHLSWDRAGTDVAARIMEGYRDNGTTE